MTFLSDVTQFAGTVNRRNNTLLTNVGSYCWFAITKGSALVGSPGQVVQDVGGGTLLASWQIVRESATSILIGSGGAAEGYNLQNEDGVRRPGPGPYIQRSAIGGRHSVSKTVDGFQRIVNAEVAKLTGAP